MTGRCSGGDDRGGRGGCLVCVWGGAEAHIGAAKGGRRVWGMGVETVLLERAGWREGACGRPVAQGGGGGE